MLSRPMSKIGQGTKVKLPLTLFRDVAGLDGHLGAAGPGDVFEAKLKILPALIGEMMIAGESDPNFFQIDYKFTIGKGPVEDPAVIQAIRDRADVLWKEFRAQAAVDADAALKARDHYLRMIDARLVQNPGLAVKTPARQGGSSKDSDRLISEDVA